MTELENAVNKTAELIVLLVNRGVIVDYAQVVIAKNAGRIPEADVPKIAEELLPTVPAKFMSQGSEDGNKPSANVFDRIREDARKKNSSDSKKTTAAERLMGNV